MMAPHVRTASSDGARDHGQAIGRQAQPQVPEQVRQVEPDGQRAGRRRRRLLGLWMGWGGPVGYEPGGGVGHGLERLWAGWPACLCVYTCWISGSGDGLIEQCAASQRSRSTRTSKPALGDFSDSDGAVRCGVRSSRLRGASTHDECHDRTIGSHAHVHRPHPWPGDGLRVH